MSGNFPGMGAPGDPIGSTLPPLESRTKAPAVRLVDARYYHCPVPSASMNSSDGTRIIFISGIYKTEVESVQRYLDNEIAHDHPNLREATAEEIRAYNMRVNPRATIKEEVTPEIESALREKLEKEIREKLDAQGVKVDDSFKVQGTDAAQRAASLMERGTVSGTGVVFSSSPSAIPAATFPATPAIPAAPVVTSGGTSFQTAIVGSDKLAGNTAGGSATSSSST